MWIRAAENVCASEGLALEWLPLDSMPVGDLEHFSLAPHRFVDFLRRNDNATVTPARVQSFTPKNPFQAGGPLMISQAFLLPGGRFLLTSSRRVGMCLWDIGYSASKPARASAIAFYPFPLDGLVGEPLPTPDAKGVLLLYDAIVCVDSQLWHRHNVDIRPDPIRSDNSRCLRFIPIMSPLSSPS